MAVLRSLLITLLVELSTSLLVVCLTSYTINYVQMEDGKVPSSGVTSVGPAIQCSRIKCADSCSKLRTGCQGFTFQSTASNGICQPVTFCSPYDVILIPSTNSNRFYVSVIKSFINSSTCSSTNSRVGLTAYAAQINTCNVSIDNQPSIPALSVFGWIVWMQRTGFSFNWALSWSSYKNGFGSAGRDFWLGLERVHLLTTSAKYRLRVELQWADDGAWSSAEYWTVVIGDEATNRYRLNVTGFSGDAGMDGLTSYHNGLQFTTYDSDHANCAVAYTCGWWLNGCFESCLKCRSDIVMWSKRAIVQSSRMMLQLQ